MAGATPAGNKKGDVKKVVLAYSGGLDTSVILRWLQENYGCEVVTFTADLGQGAELEAVQELAWIGTEAGVPLDGLPLDRSPVEGGVLRLGSEAVDVDPQVQLPR